MFICTMAEIVDNLVDLALKIMLDPHPRVRWVAACALKSLRDHHPQYLTPCKDKATSLMLPLIDSEIHPRIKAVLAPLESAEVFNPQTGFGSEVASMPFSCIYVLAMPWKKHSLNLFKQSTRLDV
ncbi:F-box/kelch-repeat protein [Tanacetum coccineum]